jgi:hypothetical protein
VSDVQQLATRGHQKCGAVGDMQQLAMKHMNLQSEYFKIHSTTNNVSTSLRPHLQNFRSAIHICINAEASAVMDLIT